MQQKKKLPVYCLTTLLITEECVRQAPDLIRILRRTGSSIPQQLQAMVQGVLEGKEEEKENELCHYMKAFGKCRDEDRCPSRHIVCEELDAPGASKQHIKLPTSGTVKVLVTHVQDATCLWVRLLGHQDQGKVTKFGHSFLLMVTNLNTWFRKPEHRLPCKCPTVGDLFALEDIQHTYHRVQVCEVQYDNHNKIDKVQVTDVDIGRTQWVGLDRLFLLPSKFLDTPYQAVKVYVCRLKPLDGDIEWTPKANYFITDLIREKELEGKIVLSLGNTLWLDPLVEHVKLKELKTVIRNFSITTELVKHDLAIANPQHLQMLYAACQGRIDMPEILDPGKTPNIGYNMEGLPVSYRTADLREDWTAVTLTAIDTPGRFYVQLRKNEKRLEDMYYNIQDHVNLGNIPSATTKSIRVGSLVVAKCPDVDRWYRGKVMEDQADQYDILNLDTGEQDYVPKPDVLSMPPKFMGIPFQAIECSLAYVDPIGEEWTEVEGDVLWKLASDEQDTALPLWVKVMKSREFTATACTPYIVKLVNSSAEYDVDLSQEMIASGKARASQMLKKEMFKDWTEGPDNNKTDSNYQQIPSLCSSLLDTQDLTSALTLTSEIDKLLFQNQSEIEELIHGSLQCLCRLMGYLHQPLVIEHVGTYLLKVFFLSESNYEVFCYEGLPSFIRLQAKADNPVVLKFVVGALTKLACENSVCKHEIVRLGALGQLASILCSDQPEEMMENCIIAIETLVEDKSHLHRVKTECVEAVCHQLSLASNPKVTRLCLIVLESFTEDNRLMEAIRKCGGVKILCKMLATMAGYQLEVLQLLVALADSSINREIMLEEDLHQTLHSLKQQENKTEDIQALVSHLQEVLGENTPIPKANTMHSGFKQGNGELLKPVSVPLGAINNKPLSKDQMSQDSVLVRKFPNVQWAQNRWNILLDVEVHGVDDPSCVTITKDCVDFRAVIHRIEYTFTFKLYELLNIKDCAVEIHPSSVMIGLRKQSRGRWPRLLKVKGRVPYLHIAYERFVDSSSESEEEGCRDETPLRAFIRHKLKKELPRPPPGCQEATTEAIPEALYEEQAISRSSSGDSSDEEREHDRFNIFSVKS